MTCEVFHIIPLKSEHHMILIDIYMSKSGVWTHAWEAKFPLMASC